MKKVLICFGVLGYILLGVVAFHEGYFLKIGKYFNHTNTYSFQDNMKYEQKMQAFEYPYIKKDVDVVVVGDSIIDYFEWSEAFPDLNIVNRGIASDVSGGGAKQTK